MVQTGRGPIYIFDSSVWIDCDGRTGDNRIPILLERLFQSGRLCSPKEVFAELERADSISPWVHERRTKLNAPRGLPVDYARNIGLVQHRFPAMGKALGPRRRADPFVVALSLTYNSDQQPWIVVCAESRNNRPNRKVPGACDALGLPCITLDQLIEREVPNDGEG
jgi:hypothetical protein